MSSPPKSLNLQLYRVVLYRRALHPELFSVCDRRVIRHGGYDFEAWIMPGTHLMRFQHDDHCATELITDQEEGIPERGAVAVFPCAGEREHEERFGEQVSYACSVQTEQLPESIYRATFEELIEFGRESDALIHEWDDESGRCATILDLQRYRNEVHGQAYHMLAQGGLVLRTQSLFEIVTEG